MPWTLDSCVDLLMDWEIAAIVSRTVYSHRWRSFGTAGLGKLTSRTKSATDFSVGEGRRGAINLSKAFSGLGGARHRGDKPVGIRVIRLPYDCIYRTVFNNAARVHDCNGIYQFRDYT